MCPLCCIENVIELRHFSGGESQWFVLGKPYCFISSVLIFMQLFFLSSGVKTVRLCFTWPAIHSRPPALAASGVRNTWMICKAETRQTADRCCNPCHHSYLWSWKLSDYWWTQTDKRNTNVAFLLTNPQVQLCSGARLFWLTQNKHPLKWMCVPEWLRKSPSLTWWVLLAVCTVQPTLI